jgi:hypothetical protein
MINQGAYPSSHQAWQNLKSTGIVSKAGQHIINDTHHNHIRRRQPFM